MPSSGPDIVAAPPARRDLPASVLMLVAANAVPLFGVLLLHWSVYAILLLYWCENVVIGGINVLRILLAQPRDVGVNITKAFLLPFFCVHYGMFTFVHGMFVVTLFGPKHNHAPLMSIAGLAAQVKAADVGLGLFAIVVSHGFSFVHNYLMGGEYRRASPQVLMSQPYARVVVLHLTIIFGGFATMALGQPVWALVLLIALKTAVDVGAHMRERSRLASDTNAISAP